MSLKMDINGALKYNNGNNFNPVATASNVNLSKAKIHICCPNLSADDGFGPIRNVSKRPHSIHLLSTKNNFQPNLTNFTPITGSAISLRVQQIRDLDASTTSLVVHVPSTTQRSEQADDEFVDSDIGLTSASKPQYNGNGQSEFTDCYICSLRYEQDHKPISVFRSLWNLNFYSGMTSRDENPCELLCQVPCEHLCWLHKTIKANLHGSHNVNQYSRLLLKSISLPTLPYVEQSGNYNSKMSRDKGNLRMCTVLGRESGSRYHSRQSLQRFNTTKSKCETWLRESIIK